MNLFSMLEAGFLDIQVVALSLNRMLGAMSANTSMVAIMSKEISEPYLFWVIGIRTMHGLLSINSQLPNFKRIYRFKIQFA